MHKILQNRESNMAESVGKTENILVVKFSMNLSSWSFFFILLFAQCHGGGSWQAEPQTVDEKVSRRFVARGTRLS